MELTKEFVKKCNKPSILRDFLLQAMDQIDAIEEERRWRKFPDEKPEHNGIYIVLLGEHTRTLDMYDTDKGKFRTYMPTAWMPLPPAPKEEK